MNQPQPRLQEAPPPHETSPGTYERCPECGAPLDRRQRYCVNCGGRRGDAVSPASRYFASASIRRRRAAARPSQPTTGSGGRAAAVAFFALLPVAVAIGVLVGRGGGSNDSVPPNLLSALNHGAATSAGSGSSQDVANTSSKLLPSDFSLDNGYTVKLDLLPIQGTDAAAANSAKKGAESKGAKQVGIINPSDFTTTPDQGQKDYILYSGEYEQKADAEKALGSLKKRFPAAQVIAVRSSGASSKAGAVSKQNVLAQTSHGVIHKVTGIKPTKQELQKDTKTVQQIAKATGKSYVDRQRKLPDIIAIGGNSSNPPPLPTGGGD